MKKKRIWIINHYASDMYKNQGGRHYWFAQNLIKQGYEPTIICANTFHNSPEFIETYKEKYTIDTLNNIPFVFVKTSVALGNGLDRVKNMVYFYWNLLNVAKSLIKKHGKPDVILASSVHPLTMVAGIKIGKKHKIPCICEIRDLWPEAIFAFNKAKENSLIGKVLVNGEKWIYKNANALIFTKEGDVDYIIEKKWNKDQGGSIDLDKCHYINNGVDINAFDRAVDEYSLNDEDLHTNKMNVVYVGAIRPVNNIGNILDAAKKLNENDDIQFLIYGDGNQRGFLEERIQKENITNVKMKGFVNKKYIPYILSKSSVNVLNYSQTQYNWARGNSSNKLFEYMASGKPVISTISMGYSIIEKYKCGLELKNNNATELANAILEVKCQSQKEYKELSKNARIGAHDFDFKKLTLKLTKVIEGLTNDDSKSGNVNQKVI